MERLVMERLVMERFKPDIIFKVPEFTSQLPFCWPLVLCPLPFSFSVALDP